MSEQYKSMQIKSKLKIIVSLMEREGEQAGRAFRVRMGPPNYN